jgi:site-specific DNA-methyltransferase (adenine-specific)/modification methylase
MPDPYAKVGNVTLYHADCRDILPQLAADTVITDPVWPDAEPPLEGRDDPHQVLRDTLQTCRCADRIAIQVGCNTDPRFMNAVPEYWDFFRTSWLEQALKGHRGRLLDTGDVAFLFGTPPPSRDGHHMIPGSTVTRSGGGKERDHPTPRRLEHVEWLMKWWTAPRDIIVDPFAGSGTTGLAAMRWDRECILIECVEQHCETAAEALEREAAQPRLEYA